MTIKWKIEGMKTSTQQINGFNNVVLSANWRASLEEIRPDRTYNATVFGTCGFSVPESEFVSYEQLTAAQVLQWCYNSGVNKEDIEQALIKDIEMQEAPKEVELPLPWVM